MHILLYVPDNHVSRNFVPQLWPFILKERTPAGHRVTIIDGNARRLSAAEIVQFVRDEGVDLVGMGFMTRMARTAYQVAAAVRAETSARVVLGGPHVTAVPDEPLGRTGLARVADAVVIGEADDIWPEIVADAARGAMADSYGPDGHGVKPTLEAYKLVDWESVDLGLFDLMRFVPNPLRRVFTAMGIPFQKIYVIPVESGRGCPYGCEFCSVTGFFGRDLRYRSNESVIAELLSLKRVAKRDRALISVFFVDDNFAIDRKRLKSLLRDMIARDACVPWTGQISVNLLDDEELVELIHRSGGRFIFMGLESVDPGSLKSAHKSFNKPADYGRILERMARHDIYAITSFIVGLDGDRPGTAARLEAEIAKWPPVLPVFGLLTPIPGDAALRQAQGQRAAASPHALARERVVQGDVRAGGLHDRVVRGGAPGGVDALLSAPDVRANAAVAAETRQGDGPADHLPGVPAAVPRHLLPDGHAVGLGEAARREPADHRERGDARAVPDWAAA